ncbi:hypothetical protein UF33_20265 [Vibrio parahaemolyticus]|nr:hypothetical protein UF33_20265 [Vibrio parahaemolyticus]
MDLGWRKILFCYSVIERVHNIELAPFFLMCHNIPDSLRKPPRAATLIWRFFFWPLLKKIKYKKNTANK